MRKKNLSNDYVFIFIVNNSIMKDIKTLFNQRNEK